MLEALVLPVLRLETVEPLPERGNPEYARPRWVSSHPKHKGHAQIIAFMLPRSRVEAKQVALASEQATYDPEHARFFSILHHPLPNDLSRITGAEEIAGEVSRIIGIHPVEPTRRAHPEPTGLILEEIENSVVTEAH